MKFVIEGQEEKQEPTLHVKMKVSEAGNLCVYGRDERGHPWLIFCVTKDGSVQIGTELGKLGLTKV